MTRDVDLILVTPKMEDDDYGIPQISGEELVTVLARIESVTASEFFDGGRNGLRPEYRFTMFLYDYDGQKEVEYDGVRYSVYRTYMGKSDTIELYVQLKGETNG